MVENIMIFLKLSVDKEYSISDSSPWEKKDWFSFHTFNANLSK